MIKILLLLCLALPIINCGTSIKIKDVNKTTSAATNKVLASLVYDFKDPHFEYTPRHEVFIFNSKGQRTNIKVPSKYDLKKGVLIELEANSAYAVSGILSYTTGLFDFGNQSFGFRTQAEKVNVITLPKIFLDKNKDYAKFYMEKLSPDYYKSAIDNYKQVNNISDKNIALPKIKM